MIGLPVLVYFLLTGSVSPLRLRESIFQSLSQHVTLSITYPENVPILFKEDVSFAQCARMCVAIYGCELIQYQDLQQLCYFWVFTDPDIPYLIAETSFENESVLYISSSSIITDRMCMHQISQ